MKSRILLLLATAGMLASCGDSSDKKNGPLTQFDACSCATVQDMNSDDYKKCKELRADAKFDADYQKCKMAAASGIADTSRLTIQNAATATNLPSADAGSYTIDVATSSLRWFGTKVTGKKHNGTLNVKSGNFTMSEGKLISGEITIDMATLTDVDQSGEGKAKLETHLKSEDFFNVAKFPEAKYVVTSATTVNPLTFDVKGNLTIKGITKEVSCQLVVSPNGNAVNLGGGFKFDRSQFDVRYGSDTFFDNLGNDMIENDITITLDIKAKK
jgi:polyisoprenoid-binding protein YceI